MNTNQITEIFVFRFKYISFDVSGNNGIFPVRINYVTKYSRLFHTLNFVCKCSNRIQITP